MTVQEKHDLLDLFLLFPGGDDLAGAVLADSRNLQQTFGVLLNNIEGCFPKMTDNPLGQFRTNALDHPRAEITFHARHRGGQHLFTDFGLELPSVFGMLIPDPLQTQMLAGRQFWQVANHRDQPLETQAWQMLSTTHFGTQAQYSVSVFGIVEGDALNGTGKVVH